VGDDAFGHLLLGTLARAGIDVGGLRLAEEVFTTLAFVTLDSRGERSFSFARKPGADTCLRPEEVDLTMIDRTAVFHFGTLSLTHEPARAATVMAVERAKSGGKMISFDPNLRLPLWEDPDEAKRQMLWGLSQADVVKISREEMEFLFGLEPAAGARRILSEYGVKLVYVTCGGDGCWFDNGSARGVVPALEGLHTVDTTGAGDIFGGSAMWRLLKTGKKPEKLTEGELREITAFACAAAGLSTEKMGGISGAPDYEQVVERLK